MNRKRKHKASVASKLFLGSFAVIFSFVMILCLMLKINLWVRKSERTGSKLNKKPPVRAAVMNSATRSIRRNSLALNMDHSNVRRILKNDINFLLQVHSFNDIENDAVILNLWTSDDVYFHLNGFVNNLNWVF
ncbi:hypothetical protein C0J52_27264 [Blattella germanica]|nr:hypothetical protein C0J52_27264 [Blattella germanica]